MFCTIRSPPFCHRRFSACGQTNNWEPLFSHTQPLESLSAPPLTSQGRCLCTVLLCHGRLVPLGSALANPSLSFLGAGPVFSQGSLFISPSPHLLPPTLCNPGPTPLPFSLSQSLSTHTPNTMALKCENLKTKKGLQPPFEACCKTSKSPRA